MFDNEIMMQGERLKKYRINMLRVTQEEISEGVYTKTMISLIENNKQKLNFNLATRIAKNLNRIANKKGLDLSLITPEELMIDDDEQANYVFENNILNELQKKATNLFEKKISEAEKLIEKYRIADNNKIELYKLSADIYYNKYQYTRSDEMCNNGIKICLDSKNIEEEANLYIYKSSNSIKIIHYNDSLKQLDYAEKLNNQICNFEFYVRIVYNRALTYKKLGDYDSALKYLEILKGKHIKNKTMVIKIKMVYANCLNELHKFHEAENEYIETLDKAMEIDDKDFIVLTYKNLSELYFNQKKYKYAAKYIKYSLFYAPNNEYLNEILYFAANVLKNLDEDVEQYLLQALAICEKKDRENLDLIEKILYELVLIYIKREDEENITLMVEKAKELNINCCLIYAELIKYYRYRQEWKSNYFNDELIDKLKQIS